MVPVAFFLAAAVEITTLFMVWVCLCGEDADAPEMWSDARKVFGIGTLLAAGTAGLHFVTW